MEKELRYSAIISSVYCLFGITWITLSTIISSGFMQNNNAQTIKGELFVVISAVLIFILAYFFYKKYFQSLQKYMSEKQNVQQEFGINEKRFRALVEHAEDMIFLIGENGNVLYVSPAFEKITGLKSGEIIGKPGFEIIQADQIEESQKVLKKILNQPGIPIHRTNKFRHKDGHYIFVEGTVINLLHDENVGAIVSTYRDITQKKNTELQMEFDANNLKAMINNTYDLMWSVDRNFKLITCNKSFNEVVKVLSGKEIEKGNNVLAEGFSEEQLNRFKIYYERAFSGEIFTEIEHLTDPEDYWSEISFYPIHNEGEVVGTACFSKNITEQVLAEMKLKIFANELKHNELKLRQAQELAHIGSWELDFSEGIAKWSDESCKIYGLSPEDNKHSYDDWLLFIHPDDLEYVVQITKQSQDTFSPASFYHRIIRNDGSIRHIYSQTHFEFDEQGRAMGIYGTAHDVTEQKLIEQEVLEKNKQLRNLSNHIQHIREEERTLISQEIHDKLGQHIAALKMDIDWVLHKQNNPDDAVISKLNEMLKFSESLITTIRRISTGLRPAIIDDIGLIAALEWKCNEFEEKMEIPCKFISMIPERRFENDFGITAYRILQETLTNVSKHSEASSVTVTVSETETALFLEITDDGKGITTENIYEKKLGILGMQERAAVLGGELIISGQENTGTNIKLMLPFKKACA